MALLIASWFAIDWSDAGAEEYAGGVVLRDDAGEVLRVALGPGDVDCRPYYTANPDDWIVKAIVAVEDDTYWNHCGVRPLSILRAAAQNLFYRRRISGASTITMQAVRLIHPHPKNLWWKYKESIMALKMERSKDKRWILSQYLNRAPYGSNFVGIESASSGWFGKRAGQLGLSEAAMLAGMVQAPSRFRPDRGLAAALRRRDYVLERMHKTGVITAEQLEGAKSVIPVVRRAPRPFKHPHFCDWALRRLGKAGENSRQSGDITTTLNADVQATVESAVQSAATAGGYSVAAVVMKSGSADVVAMACSGDYFEPDSGQVNTALTPRPAGSTLKPFLTALALDLGHATPGERLDDVPMAFKGYRPANFDAAYRGKVSVRDALIQSLNLPFVQLLRRLGIDVFGRNLRELGFAHIGDSDDSLGLGMAIGNVEVSLLELVNAYATIARGGVLENGSRIYSEGACYLVSDMLSGAERSSAALGHVAEVRTSRFAWKTGTSAAYRDAWTVVWNPEYVIGVWCGHKKGGFGDKTLVGAKAASPVAWTIARSLYPQHDGPWFAKPAEVGMRRICALTGLPANPNCPHVEEGTFLRGYSQVQLCDAHRLDGDGRVIEVVNTKLRQLSILKPEDGATFMMVPGMAQQRIVCQVAGNRDDSELWWFIDGRPAGTTRGRQAFVMEMSVGRHVVECSTADGDFASVSFTVTSPPNLARLATNPR